MGEQGKGWRAAAPFGVKSWEFGLPQRGITWSQGRAAIGEGMKTKEKGLITKKKKKSIKTRRGGKKKKKRGEKNLKMAQSFHPGPWEVKGNGIDNFYIV